MSEISWFFVSHVNPPEVYLGTQLYELKLNRIKLYNL